MRKTIFANGEYYHIYNRGVDKREVFLDEEDYKRFLICLREFNNDLTREERLRIKMHEAALSELNSGSELSSDSASNGALVEINLYCLNSNHYHIALRQLADKGIEKFMHKISTGYTNYFNKKYKRSGSLFQGRFKDVYVDSNEYLLYLSAYINKNHFIHNYGNDSDWPYCSAPDYLGKRNGTLCNKESILSQFRKGEYESFLDENAQYLKDKKDLEKYCLE